MDKSACGAMLQAQLVAPFSYLTGKIEVYLSKLNMASTGWINFESHLHPLNPGVLELILMTCGSAASNAGFHQPAPT